MTTKEAPVAVQRYEIFNRRLTANEKGPIVTFEDYQRDIAAAERRGAEKAREAAAKLCLVAYPKDEDEHFDADPAEVVTECIDAIRSLPIEQILKGEE
jgi:hypothetical protein